MARYAVEYEDIWRSIQSLFASKERGIHFLPLGVWPRTSEEVCCMSQQALMHSPVSAPLIMFNEERGAQATEFRAVSALLLFKEFGAFPRLCRFSPVHNMLKIVFP